MVLSYLKQTTESQNPLARFAHQKRFGLAIKLIKRYLPANGTLLDYGTGDGRVIKLLKPNLPEARLLGYEPYMEALVEYERVKTYEACFAESYDVISAFEVLEHLRAPDVAAFLELIMATLKPSGYLIISVPQMLGPILIPKLINAAFVKKTDWTYSFTEALSSAVCLRSPPREDRNQYLNHKGFDWRDIETILAKNLTIESRIMSPFPKLWWGVNSQCFSIWRR
jgi:SAM-dependent methyltransferase